MAKVLFSHFDLNRTTIKALAVGPECRKLVLAHAEVAKAHAMTLAIARVGRSTERKKSRSKSGRKHYLDAFEVDAEIVEGITPKWPLTRVAGRLANTARHATLIELGHETSKRGRKKEVAGRYVLTDTLKWLWSFDTDTFTDEPGGDGGYTPPDFDADIQLDFGDD